MSDPWRVTLLGGLRAQQGERVITRFKTQKVAALFAYLAFHLRQAHPREVLIELLWPESDAPTLRNSLSVALSSLRHQFEPPGVPQGTILRADRFSVSLNPALVTTDVADFERALQEAGRAGSSLERAQHLTQAVELYQGPLLPGLYEDWIAAEQERLAGLFGDALGALVRFLEEGGDVQAALSHARRAVAIDPLREEAQAQLIRLLAADGQSGAALRRFQEYELLLEEELGSGPSASLRRLMRGIESGTGGPVAPRAEVRHPARPVATPALGGPTTLTFLVTAIAESPRLAQQAPGAYAAARERHHALLRETFARHGGAEVQETGDGFVVTFPNVTRPPAAAVSAQQAVAAELWPGPVGPLQVRMAVHSGDVHGEGYGREGSGPVLHYAAALLGAAAGGQILVSDATAALAPAPASEDMRLVDLGLYRLCDLPRERRLFQVEYAGMPPTDLGRLSAAAGHRTHLPPRFTRFFGRAQEIAVLWEWLLSPEVRLVTVTGAAGHGKTRVALEVAQRLADPFAGAVYFVPLAELSDPELIAGAVLDSLQIPRSPHTSLVEQVAAALSRRPHLLVLDNLEQLGPGAAHVVHALLARAPELKVLATTRQLLGLSAEREFALAPLPPPLSAESPELLSLYDSVQLFLDRAQQVMPHFQVTNANAAAVAALVDGLEGIPLAIELAAARVQVLTPAQMLAQLSQRLNFLATRKRDVAERQASLRAALSWSYRLLTPELQRFLARLSVFRGGWSVQAAEAVCEEPLALDYLEQLRECSLVIHADCPVGELRFRMLETLREYAQEHLGERGEVEALRHRHLHHFLDLAEQADRQTRAGGPGDWLLRLESDHDNLRAALTWSAAAAPGGDFDPRSSGVRLAGLLEVFWIRRGHLAEGRERLSQLLATEAVNPADRALALTAAGGLAGRQLDLPAARELLEQALALRRQSGDPTAVAASLNGLGRLATLHGDHVRAHLLLEESLALSRALGDKRAIAAALINLATLADNSNDPATAESLLREALEIARALDDRMLIAASLMNLGVLSDLSGDYAAARRHYEERLALRTALGDRVGIADTLHNLGSVAVSAEDYPTARLRLLESLTLRRDLGDRLGGINSLEGLAALAVVGSETPGEETGARRGARLFGAAHDLRRALATPLPAPLHAWIERFESPARAVLGEAGYAAEFEAGREMTWDAAVVFALEGHPA